MSIIFNTTDKIKYANTKAECRIHQFDVFDVAKLCYDERLNKHQMLCKATTFESTCGKLAVGFAIIYANEHYHACGTFGDYFIQFKDGLAAIVIADDFKEMHKNDFIELHNKIKERLHE